MPVDSEGQWPYVLFIEARALMPGNGEIEMMTFEQFQATKTHCDDIGAAISDARWEHEPVPAKGNLYLGELYIEEVLPHFSPEMKHQGKWYLTIHRDEWVSDDLEDLERKLYEFAKDEGFLDE